MDLMSFLNTSRQSTKNQKNSNGIESVVVQGVSNARRESVGQVRLRCIQRQVMPNDAHGGEPSQ
jgi:hypothetical protein